MKQLDDNPLSRKLLAKQAATKVLALLHQRKVLATLLAARKGNQEGVSFKKKLDVCWKLGTLRQLIVELLAVPGKNAVDSGHLCGDK